MKKFLKVSSTFFIIVVGLVSLFSFSFVNITVADTTSTLRPTADGGDDSGDWKNAAGTSCTSADCYLDLDESSGSSCTNSDGDTSFIEAKPSGASITFDIDESSIPNDSTITAIDITVCHKQKKAAGSNDFQTRRCVDASCSNSGTNISAGADYAEATQSHSGLNITKTSSTDIEIGIVIIGTEVRISQISTVITYTPPDTTAPNAVTNLSSSNATQTSIDLSWTAPGDDGNSGTSTSYDVRYSTSTITTGNWSSATQATGEPTPSVAGFAESMTISGLTAGTTYYFALKTSDEVPNESGLSNVESLTTLSPPSDDIAAPAAVTDLASSDATGSSIDLSWTAPGDDGNTGTANSYNVRYSTSEITDANWSSATQATGEPTPSSAGTAESMTVSGLTSGTTYYFALKTSDEVGNESGLSNVPSLATTGTAEEEEEEETPVPEHGQQRIVFITGQAYPECEIEVLSKRTEIASFTKEPVETLKIENDGTFSITLTGLIGADFLFALRVEDKGGRKTGIISFNVDLRAENELIAENIFVPPTIGFEETIVRKGEEVKIEGFSAPNNKIQIEIDGEIKGETQSSAIGYWSFTMATSDLELGEHYVKVRQIKQSGRLSDFSFPRAFKVSVLTNPKADFNNDNTVNITDWSIFLFRWGSEDQILRLKIDMDDNGRIDIADFSIFLKTMKI